MSAWNTTPQEELATASLTDEPLLRQRAQSVQSDGQENKGDGCNLEQPLPKQNKRPFIGDELASKRRRFNAAPTQRDDGNSGRIDSFVESNTFTLNNGTGVLHMSASPECDVSASPECDASIDVHAQQTIAASSRTANSWQFCQFICNDGIEKQHPYEARQDTNTNAAASSVAQRDVPSFLPTPSSFHSVNRCGHEGCTKFDALGNLSNGSSSAFTPTNDTCCGLVQENVCKHDGCPQPVDTGGFCLRHWILTGPGKPTPKSKSDTKPKPKPTCGHEGCTKRVRARGRCREHDPKGECQHEGCTKFAYARGRCAEHDTKPKPTCGHEGCTKFAHARGRCAEHDTKPKPTCGHEGCTKFAYARGRCAEHDTKPKPTCGHEGCTKFAYARGRCAEHDTKPKPTCGHEGCTKQVRARGRCAEHDTKPKPKPTCGHEGCTKYQRSDCDDFCIQHWKANQHPRLCTECNVSKQCSEFSRDVYRRSDEEDRVCRQCQTTPTIPTDDEQVILLKETARLWNPTPRAHQSSEWRLAVLACINEGIDFKAISHYIRVNAYKDKLSEPYWKDKIKCRIDGALKFLNKPLVRRVPVAERKKVDDSKRDSIESAVRSRLGLDSAGKPTSNVILNQVRHIKGSEVKVYRLPTAELEQFEPNLSVKDKFESRLPPKDCVPAQAFVEKHQKSVSITKEQADRAVVDASKQKSQLPADFLLDIVNDSDGKKSFELPEVNDKGRFFWYKGILYFVWIDVPKAVWDQTKEKHPELFRDATAVKIGCSGEDLILHLQKMQKLLTHLAGATLCYAAIGIPFGLCQAYVLEQSVHFRRAASHLTGEHFDSALFDVEAAILDIVSRIGGKVIFRGSVSGKDCYDGVNAGSAGEDGPGWMYVAKQYLTKEEYEFLLNLKTTLSDLGNTAAVKWIDSQLASKVGATRGEVAQVRVRKSVWALARARLEYFAVTGHEKVFEAEKACHNEQVKPEDKDDTEFELLKQKYETDERFTVQYDDNLSRAWEKNSYYEMEVKEWLTLGLVTLDEIIELLMEGVFQLV